VYDCGGSVTRALTTGAASNPAIGLQQLEEAPAEQQRADEQHACDRQLTGHDEQTRASDAGASGPPAGDMPSSASDPVRFSRLTPSAGRIAEDRAREDRGGTAKKSAGAPIPTSVTRGKSEGSSEDAER
jgi:hypothetical protein